MDIASDCGFSKSTVAYALNGTEGKVSLNKRNIILKSASKLGYRPNIMAQSLRSGKTNSIGLLWSLGGPHDSLGLVRDISIRLMRKGYACHVADSLSDPKIIKQCLIDFRSRNVDGLIVQFNEQLCKNKEILNLLNEINNVIVVTPEAIDIKFDNLILERTSAIREIVDHFAANGRKNMIFLTTSDNARQNVFVEQLKYHNLASSNDSIIRIKEDCSKNDSTSLRWDYFVNALKNKFNGKIPFDALVCSADEGAAAVINYLNEMGYRVPEDIAVSGYNNSGMASYLRPPLASVDRRNQDAAECVTEMLFNRLRTPALAPQKKLIKMKFVYRQSAG